MLTTFRTNNLKGFLGLLISKKAFEFSLLINAVNIDFHSINGKCICYYLM